jgi:hypothetical protein
MSRAFIEPLLLIPFIENAFKHISHKTDGNNFVSLTVRSNSCFEFTVENSHEKEFTPQSNMEALVE